MSRYNNKRKISIPALGSKHTILFSTIDKEQYDPGEIDGGEMFISIVDDYNNNRKVFKKSKLNKHRLHVLS